MFEADEAQDIGYIAVEDGTVPNINIQASSMQFEPNINSQAFSQFSQSVSGLKGCVIKVGINAFINQLDPFNFRKLFSL
jgi:hypothetical protein